MNPRFLTLTGLACSLLAIASAPAVWGILTFSAGGAYSGSAEQVEAAKVQPQGVAPAVELAAAAMKQREAEFADEETARP